MAKKSVLSMTLVALIGGVCAISLASTSVAGATPAKKSKSKTSATTAARGSTAPRDPSVAQWRESIEPGDWIEAGDTSVWPPTRWLFHPVRGRVTYDQRITVFIRVERYAYSNSTRYFPTSVAQMWDINCDTGSYSADSGSAYSQSGLRGRQLEEYNGFSSQDAVPGSAGESVVIAACAKYAPNSVMAKLQK
jgi:hypothetical protein